VTSGTTLVDHKTVPILQPERIRERYDLVVAGTGFGSLFFVHGFVDRFPRARVLMIEWGRRHEHAWQIANHKNSEWDPEQTYVRQAGQKPWIFNIGYGGGTNCWGAQTPRMAPDDFRLKSRYGVGRDWPLTYDDLEPFYVEAERIMQVSGANDISRFYPRSAPYPQSPFRLSAVDERMKSAMPDRHFAAPSARLSASYRGRPPCCNTGDCSFCPVDAKFTALNTFGPLLERENVDVILESRVHAVEMKAGTASGLAFTHAGTERVASGDLVAVGANAIHSPFLLLRSGLEHPALGKYLHEKLILNFTVLLKGMEAFGGGTHITSLNTAWVSGEHRRTGGAGLVYFANSPRFGFRTEWGRWRETQPIEVFVEEEPLESNYVAEGDGDLPVVHHEGPSPYARRGADRVVEKLPELLAPLPVEDIVRLEDSPTAYHVQGTCRMGDDPKTTVVDGHLVHHEIRNLLVLGTAVFPSCTSANPSLTAAALSLRAARQLAA
jgi:choline dehydrogenase-like flavoprotein